MSVRENKLFDAFQSNVPCAYLLKTRFQGVYKWKIDFKWVKK